jgi:hypothetical protein
MSEISYPYIPSLNLLLSVMDKINDKTALFNIEHEEYDLKIVLRNNNYNSHIIEFGYCSYSNKVFNRLSVNVNYQTEKNRRHHCRHAILKIIKKCQLKPEQLELVFEELLLMVI